MSERQIWIGVGFLALYAVLVIVFREAAESALSAILNWIGGAL